jgi:hypothetical protein
MKHKTRPHEQFAPPYGLALSLGRFDLERATPPLARKVSRACGALLRCSALARLRLRRGHARLAGNSLVSNRGSSHAHLFRIRNQQVFPPARSHVRQPPNDNAADFLRWIGLWNPKLCGRIPARDLAAILRRRLWPSRKEAGDHGRAAQAMTEPGRATLIDCPRDPGRLAEYGVRLLGGFRRRPHDILGIAEAIDASSPVPNLSHLMLGSILAAGNGARSSSNEMLPWADISSI